MLLDEFRDLNLLSNERYDRTIQGGSCFIERVEFERITGGNKQSSTFATDWEDGVAINELLREGLQLCKIDVGFTEVDIFESEFFCHGAEHIFFAHEAFLHNAFEDTSSVGSSARLEQLGLVDQPSTQKNFTRFEYHALIA
jgi:hypothetical protein